MENGVLEIVVVKVARKGVLVLSAAEIVVVSTVRNAVKVQTATSRHALAQNFHWAVLLKRASSLCKTRTASAL